MSNKVEKEKRSLIKRKLKNLEKEELLDSLPIPIATLQQLFDWLDLKLSKKNCDDSLRLTLAFIKSNQLTKNEIVEWLRNNGGYCDCEILANVEEQINDK